MLQFKSQFQANALEISLYFSCTRQCCLNMRQDVLGSNMLQKIGARDKSRWLIPRAAQKQSLAGLTQSIGELLQGMDAGCVESGHIPKAQDHDVCKRLQILVASASFSVVPKRNGP